MEMNKRGQEGITIGTLLLIVLGVVVVVVIIIGATSGFGFIFEKIDVLPGQGLEAVVQSCAIAGEQNLKADYCKQFKEVEIDGVDQQVTCSYSTIEGLLDADKKLDGGCTDSLIIGSVSDSFCVGGKVDVDDWDDTLVNGRNCFSWLGIESDETTSCTTINVEGYDVEEGSDPCGSGDIDLTDLVALADGNNCCLVKEVVEPQDQLDAS
tara:strand:- start:5 stop:631 length:627 start_codon:yes stop_codon:yes gene_type:complete